MKYKVSYNTKSDDKASSLYGVLIERTANFDSLQSAMKFARDLQALKKSGVTLVGKPTVEVA
jgi:hypothetical protein